MVSKPGSFVRVAKPCKVVFATRPDFPNTSSGSRRYFVSVARLSTAKGSIPAERSTSVASVPIIRSVGWPCAFSTGSVLATA